MRIVGDETLLNWKFKIEADQVITPKVGGGDEHKSDDPEYSIGDNIEALYIGDSAFPRGWYHAVVTAINSDASFKVKWDDGSASRQTKDEIRPVNRAHNAGSHDRKPDIIKPDPIKIPDANSDSMPESMPELTTPRSINQTIAGDDLPLPIDSDFSTPTTNGLPPPIDSDWSTPTTN